MQPDFQAPLASDYADRPSFLASHRALSACTRELARLTEMLCRGAATLREDLGVEKLDVRLTPDRCVVQLGPVALTIAWLRSTLGTPENGELLVIVWRGSVAQRGAYHPARAGSPPMVRTASVLSERTYTAAAADEASWVWRTPGEARDLTSAALAEQCVEQLRDAYATERAAAPRKASA